MRTLLIASLVLGLACGDDDEERSTAPARAEAAAGGERPADDNGRCEGGADREISEYDTSGDDYPDVRKVFLVVGTGRLSRLVLICREADLNGDGTKDIVRYYSDEGRPTREEADRDWCREARRGHEAAVQRALAGALQREPRQDPLVELAAFSGRTARWGDDQPACQLQLHGECGEPLREHFLSLGAGTPIGAG